MRRLLRDGRARPAGSEHAAWWSVAYAHTADELGGEHDHLTDRPGAHLDRRIVCDLLGFDENIYEGVRRLSAKWCAEPSVHGGKARPKNAKLVM